MIRANPDPIAAAIADPRALRLLVQQRLAQDVDVLAQAEPSWFHSQAARLFQRAAVALLPAELSAPQAELVLLGEQFAEVARNLFRTAAHRADRQMEKARLASVAACYNDLYCVLHSAAREQIGIDFKALRGAANASSVNGGSGPATAGAFQAAFGTDSSALVRFSPAAWTNLLAWCADPLAQPETLSVDAALRVIADGMVLP